MEVGPIFRQIRLKKKIAAKEVYQDILNRNNFYRFEKGESSISVAKFIQLLGRLGVRLVEFGSLYFAKVSQNYDAEYLQIFQDFPTIYAQRDVVQMRKMERIFAKAYKKNKMQRDYSLGLMCTIWGDDFEFSGKLSPAGIAAQEEIYQQLLNTETWYPFSYAMFGNVVPYLDAKQTQSLLQLSFDETVPQVDSYANDTVSLGFTYVSILEQALKNYDIATFKTFVDQLNKCVLTETDIVLQIAQRVFSWQKELLVHSLTVAGYQAKMQELSTQLTTFHLHNLYLRTKTWDEQFKETLGKGYVWKA